MIEELLEIKAKAAVEIENAKKQIQEAEKVIVYATAKTEVVDMLIASEEKKAKENNVEHCEFDNESVNTNVVNGIA